MSEWLIFETPIRELIARGTLVYLAVAVILRIMPKRQTGDLAPNDLIALVVVGTLTGDAILGDITAAPDILLLIAVVLAWDYLSNLFEYHFPRFHHVAQYSPTLLIHNGEVLKKNLAREKLTEDELQASLRKQGIEEFAAVRLAVLEVDGQISVIPAEKP